MVGGACTAVRNDGRPCQATPMRDEPFCFWHAPETADEAAEARRLGGLHRRKKKAVAAIYGFGGLRTIIDIQALPLQRRPSGRWFGMAMKMVIRGRLGCSSAMADIPGREDRIRRFRAGAAAVIHDL
jgi:hypothetical protein